MSESSSSDEHSIQSRCFVVFVDALTAAVTAESVASAITEEIV